MRKNNELNIFKSQKNNPRILKISQLIKKTLSEVFLTLDFADEEVPTDVSKDVKYILTNIINDLDKESKSINVAERIRTGFEVAIVGKPNVGKSTLLNAMAGREAAITSEQAGTTRDIIEVRMDLDGLPVTMLDTAGLRETNNLIETKGITRAIERANSSDLVVMLTEDGETLPEIKNPKTLTFISKCDEGNQENGLSAVTGFGLDNMIGSIKNELEKTIQNQGLATRFRHKEAIDRSIRKLKTAKKLVDDGPASYDLVAEELRQTAYTLDELFGRVDVEKVLDEIFSSFCLGK